jgi:hypothetical protein
MGNTKCVLTVPVMTKEEFIDVDNMDVACPRAIL